jgi:hypothetical protein
MALFVLQLRAGIEICVGGMAPSAAFASLGTGSRLR